MPQDTYPEDAGACSRYRRYFHSHSVTSIGHLGTTDDLTDGDHIVPDCASNPELHTGGTTVNALTGPGFIVDERIEHYVCRRGEFAVLPAGLSDGDIVALDRPALVVCDIIEM